MASRVTTCTLDRGQKSKRSFRPWWPFHLLRLLNKQNKQLEQKWIKKRVTGKVKNILEKSKIKKKNLYFISLKYFEYFEFNIYVFGEKFDVSLS